MSFFKKAMASIGIGSAKVNAVLDNANVRAGETVTGFIHIQGGNVEQQIDQVVIHVKTKYEKEIDDKKITLEGTIQKVAIPIGESINPGEGTEIPFKFELDKSCPITLANFPIWLQTELDIESAIDPSDRDLVNVKPHRNVEVILAAIEEAGFSIKKIKNEYSFRVKNQFVQSFEFAPTGSYRSYLDELEVIFIEVKEDEVKLVLEVDRKAKGLRGLFAEAADTDESLVRYTVSEKLINAGSSAVAEDLARVINHYIR